MAVDSIEPPLANPIEKGVRKHANSLSPPRLAREWKTIEAMVRLYCKRMHRNRDEVCVECHDLLEYARLRLERCRFGAEKSTCAKCPVHCYQPDRREQIKVVMRFAGPRMLWLHPILSLRHWLDSLDGETPAPIR